MLKACWVYGASANLHHTQGLVSLQKCMISEMACHLLTIGAAEVNATLWVAEAQLADEGTHFARTGPAATAKAAAAASDAAVAAAAVALC